MNDPQGQAQAQALFSTLRKSADPEVFDAIETLIREGEDRHLCPHQRAGVRGQHGLDEEKAISAFLHASRLGLFELNWNVLCPGCGGVLDATCTLKSVHKDPYDCALCARPTSPRSTRWSRSTFTVSPRVRRIAAHDPHSLPIVEYFRQIFWGSGVDLPDHGSGGGDRGDHARCDRTAAGRKGADVGAIAGRIHHRVRAGDACGAFHRRARASRPTNGRPLRWSSIRPRRRPKPPRCGPDRCACRSTTVPICAPCRRSGSQDSSARPAGKRRPFLTAKRLLTNQTFRDLYRTDTLDVDQGLKITSLTFLFTDLKGSTALYDRVGDLVAYDLVREHFRVLNEIVAAEARRRGQDHRRRGDGDVPDARPGARRGAAHARGDAATQRRASKRIC